MCLIGVKETYVQEKKKVTKNFLGQICTTVSGLNSVMGVSLVYLHMPESGVLVFDNVVNCAILRGGGGRGEEKH